MQITFIMGNGCNLNCTYCFERNKHGDKKLNVVYAKQIIDDIYNKENSFNISKEEANILEFIGGEPFVYIDSITEIVDYYQNVLSLHGYTTDFIMRIITNATLLHTSKVKAFLDKYKDKIALNCSIDGIKVSHDKFRLDKDGNGTYDIAWNNFISSDVNSKVLKWTLTADTAKYYAEAIKFLLSQQDISRFQIAQHFNNEDENFQKYGDKDFANCICELIEWYKSQSPDWVIKHPYVMSRCDFKSSFVDYYTHTPICTAHKVCLDIDGSLVKCLCASQVSLDRPDSFVFGHIEQTTGDDRVKMYQKAFSPVYVYEGVKGTECFRCPIGNFCGACFISNYCHTGSGENILHLVCNCHALKHLEHVFFNNFWIKTYLDNVPDAKTYMLNDNTMLVGNMFRKDVLLPKCWALELLPEEIYNYICDITEELGGLVSPLDTKFYSEEQVHCIGETLAKDKSLSSSITIPEYRDMAQKGDN